MADTLRENGCDPCSEFKIADLLSGLPFGVSFEGVANFLIDHIVEREFDLGPGRRRHGNIAKHPTPSSAGAPATQMADVSHALNRPRSFLPHHESVWTAWLRRISCLGHRVQVFATAGRQPAVDTLGTP